MLAIKVMKRLGNRKHSSILRGRRGVTLVEVMLAIAVLSITASGTWAAMVFSSRSLELNRHVRAAVSDMQVLLERFHSTTKFDVFAQFPNNADVDEDTVGTFSLLNEAIQMSYAPGNAENILQEGDNEILFVKADGVGNYTVNDVELRLTFDDETVNAYLAPGGGVVTVPDPRTFTANIPAGTDLSTVVRVDLHMAINFLDSADEADIFINEKGPYSPGPQFAIDDLFEGDQLIPDLEPLRVRVTCNWTTGGRSLSRSLSTARQF